MTNELLPDDLFFYCIKNITVLKQNKRNLRLIQSKDPLFLENTMILGQKKRNLRLILSENLFFLKNTMIWG